MLLLLIFLFFQSSKESSEGGLEVCWLIHNIDIEDIETILLSPIVFFFSPL